MEILDIVSEEYEAVSPETRVSKLVGVFDDPTVKGVLVQDTQFEGVVTRRQLATSRHPPDQKVGSLVWHVPRLAPDEDVRKVARLMIDSDSQLLPVFEGDDVVGVVSADDILEAVQPFLDVATVGDVYTDELVSVESETTAGEAVTRFREHHITHLPVVEDDAAVGILSLYDMVDLTVHSGTQSQGGDATGVDAFGGGGTAGRTHRGGYGAREGELARLFDLPVRDVMVSPVRTIRPDETLETAVKAMFETDGSSLVVVEDDCPVGIVTKTDILDSLTWETGGNRAVQVYGTDLLGDVSYDDIVSMVEAFDDKDHGMNVLDAKVHLHEHDEKRRGTPLVLARIRLYTDSGLYIASGEGYGARQALNEACDIVERQIRDEKTYGRSKKHPDEAFWEKRFGWILEEAA
ncbi:CBS domain-containing protein [Halogeometricum borinquense]|uniref:CBS domain-containing protein n=1 Tax=Halogeometricum borinquense TaxID=60847 RepID=A0A482SZL7_9EURY|nr:CBS domain-containing protein [Halogeometricum borinquense]RYJ08591.1 CBS domain-containing protein [Halogeometricum borinquense]